MHASSRADSAEPALYGNPDTLCLEIWGLALITDADWTQVLWERNETQ